MKKEEIFAPENKAKIAEYLGNLINLMSDCAMDALRAIEQDEKTRSRLFRIRDAVVTLENSPRVIAHIFSRPRDLEAVLSKISLENERAIKAAIQTAEFFLESMPLSPGIKLPERPEAVRELMKNYEK